MSGIEQENKNTSSFGIALPFDFDGFYEKIRDYSSYSSQFLTLSKTPIEDSLISTETTSVSFSGKSFKSILTLSDVATSGSSNGFYLLNTIEEIKRELCPLLKINRAEYLDVSGEAYPRLNDLAYNKEALRTLRLISKEYRFTLQIDFGTRNFVKEESDLRRNYHAVPPFPLERDIKLSNREYQNQWDQYQKNIKEKEEQLAKSIFNLKSEKNQQITISTAYDIPDGYESFKWSCANYAFIYQNCVLTLYNRSGVKYPTKTINIQYPIPEVKKEEPKTETKSKEETKDAPEITPTKIIVNLPEISAFYEFVRENQGRIEKARGGQERTALSNTEIKDKLFKNEITDLLINNSGFKILTTLNFSKEKISNNLGYYDENKQKLLINLIKKREATLKTPLKFNPSHDEVKEGKYSFCTDSHNGGGDNFFDFSFGLFDAEQNKSMLIETWKNKNPTPAQGSLSDREFFERHQDYSYQLDEYTEKVRDLENQSITLATRFSTRPSLQIDFTYLLKSYSELQRIVMESVYEVEGYQSHDIEIGYTIPKFEGEEIVTTDSKSKDDESIKTAGELEEIQKVNKRKWSEWDGFEAIGGQEKAIAEAKKLVYAIKNPEVYEKRGAKQPKGILLYGPPGTGKTMLAKAIAKESEAEFFSVSISDIGSKWHGESERMMQEVFDNANSAARNGKKAIIYFDEIDSIALNRDEAYEVSRKILSVILQNMDGVRSNKNVTVIAATNRPEDVDPAIKRSGRFDKLIEMGPPDKDGRVSIFRKQIEKIAKAATEPENMFDKKLDFEQIGNSTNGMNGADIANLINQTLEEKLIKELEGTQWAPTTTQEILDMIPKMGRATKEQRRLGFIPHK